MREMKFSEVIGQRRACERLAQMVEDNRLPHAMLLCGPAGCGKMAVAMALASYLLCRAKTAEGDSCGECTQCRLLRNWHHPDLHFSYPVIRPAGTAVEHKMRSDDFALEWSGMLARSPYFTLDTWLSCMKASNQQAVIGVGESDSLMRKLSLKSSQGGYKVSIIWLPERMNAECANKLLKVIEEPPALTVFIMVSEEPGQLLETIRSRTQRIDLRPIENDEMAQALIQHRGIDASAAERIAHAAAGSWQRATAMLAADNENNLFLDMFKTLTRTAYKRDIRELKNWSETTAAFGREKQKRMLTYFLHLIRENFMYNFHRKELCYMTADEESFAKNFSPFINEANVRTLAQATNRAIRDISQNANARIQLFDLALTVTANLRNK